RLVRFRSHSSFALHAFDEIRRFFARLETDVRFPPVALLADAAAHPLLLAADVEETHFGDLDVEELFDGVLDLDLVGLGVDLEGDGVAAALAHHGRLLRDQRAADDLIRVTHGAPPSDAAGRPG